VESTPQTTTPSRPGTASDDLAVPEHDQRWPGWVYAAGDDPDYRFSFANERTFLAWIRTALSLLAAGVALNHIELTISPAVQSTLTSILVLLGILCAVASWWRWARAERAMRRHERLPALPIALLLAAAVGLIGTVVLTLA
jgi:putative membrane protein